MKRMAKVEKLSQLMQQDIVSYKTMFERNNLTITAIYDLDTIG